MSGETVKGIRLQNYKAFLDTGWIDFNKITLLYGYNSNGKSTILKFLYQMQNCIQSYKSGLYNVSLWSDDESHDEGGYFDVLYNGNKKKSSEMKFSFKIGLDEEQKRYVENALTEFFDSEKYLKDADGVIYYTVSYKYNSLKKIIELRSVCIEYSGVLIYKYTTTHTGKFKVDTDILGFKWASSCPLPVWFEVVNMFILTTRNEIMYKTGLDEEMIGSSIGPAQRYIYHFLNGIQSIINTGLMEFISDFEYFNPIRKLPSRLIKLVQSASKRVGSYGENTYNILYAIEKDQDWKKKKKINQWLEKFGYCYEWKFSGNRLGEFLLKDLKTGYKTNILDCGFGISQILPIIVACFDENPGLIAVDSPEAHLNSLIQSDICDLFLETAVKRNVILETHSENLLLRLQRRIVEENECYPEMATVYFITDRHNGSVCEKITFNEFGDLVNPSETFKRFFSSSFEDVMQINNAKGQRIRKSNEESY